MQIPARTCRRQTDPDMSGRGTQEGRACPDSLLHPDPETFHPWRRIMTLLSAKLSVLLLHPAWLDKSSPQSRHCWISQPLEVQLGAGQRALQSAGETSSAQRGACSPLCGTLRVAVNMCSLVNTEQCINECLTVLLLQLFPVKSAIQSQIKIILFLLSAELQKHLEWAR